MDVKVTIWVDNDACPVQIKQIVYKASQRLKVPVVLVANRVIPPPKSNLVRAVTVAKGADIADQHIIDEVNQHDIVVTADVPLAQAIVDKGGVAIDPRGHIYDPATISERRSIRDFMTQLRSDGVQTGGPRGFGVKERQRFANTLDRTLTKSLKAAQTNKNP